jgi:hypothetical protein
MHISKTTLLLTLSLSICSTSFASSFERMHKALTSNESKEVYVYKSNGRISRLEKVEFVKLLDKETNFPEEVLKIKVKRKDGSFSVARNACGLRDCGNGGELIFTLLEKDDPSELNERNSVYYWKQKSMVNIKNGIVDCGIDSDVYKVKGKLSNLSLLLEDIRGTRFALHPKALADSLGSYETWCHFIPQDEYKHQLKKNYKKGDKIKFHENNKNLSRDEDKRVRTGVIRNIYGATVTVGGGIFDSAIKHRLYLDQIIEEKPLYPLAPSNYPGASTSH